MNKIKNIFFDFDGVIAESVNVKTEAFYQQYLPYGEEIAQKVKQHHLENGGMSRFEKFKYYHNNFLNKEIDEEGIKKMAKEFSDLTIKGVINSAEVRGVNNFIKKHHENHQFWIITGTPTDDMKLIAKERNSYNYFVAIYGSPEKKTYWANYIIEKHNLKKEETIFLGDAMQDYNAARNVGIEFFLRENDDNRFLFEKIKCKRFADFVEFENKYFNSL